MTKIIPAFMAFIFLMSRPFFGRRERRFTVIACLFLALLGAFLALCIDVWNSVDHGPVSPVNGRGLFLARLWDRLTRLAGQGGDWAQETFATIDPILLYAAAGVGLPVTLILYLLHRNAADPE